MSDLNLNRERIGLLRAIGAGEVLRTATGHLMRQYSSSNKARVGEGRLDELVSAGLVDDQLRLTEAGHAVIDASPKPMPADSRDLSGVFGPTPRLAATQDAPAVTTVLRWEDPPDIKRAGRWRPIVDWHRIAAQLRDRPGRWALVLDGGHNSATAAQIRDSSVSAALRPAGSFDAKSVRVDGQYRLYARYIGETEVER